MKKASWVAVGASVTGLLVWLSVRGSQWVRGELAYQRWRRQRFHIIVLPNPRLTPAQYRASGRALVWGGENDDTPP